MGEERARVTLTGKEEGERLEEQHLELKQLPEGCIAAVISMTSPRDACRLATVSKMFRSAADSDAVWDRFLPYDYKAILARSQSHHHLFTCSSKKDLFFCLATTPLLIDAATKSFSLEKSTGKKCYSIGARDLEITWADTPRYWAWHLTPDSRFPEVAELVAVCWLEIKGKIKTSMLSPDTNYVAYLIFKMAEAAYGFYSPVEMVVKTTEGKTETQKVYLDTRDRDRDRDGDGEHPRSYHQIVQRRRRIRLLSRNHTSCMSTTATYPAPKVSETGRDAKFPKPRKDGWMEVQIGEFSTPTDDNHNQDGQVEMSLFEVKQGNWKGGLLVQAIDIRPNLVL